VILVDAVSADEPVGTLVRLSGEEVAPAVLHRLSPHQVGVADLLDGARLHDRRPERLLLLGLVPGTLGLGIERSEQVERHIPLLVDEIVAQARDMGHVFVRRTVGSGDLRDRGPVARVFGL
jgi:hydrogenase maturation protease